jgi:hypothetical protein
LDSNLQSPILVTCVSGRAESLGREREERLRTPVLPLGGLPAGLRSLPAASVLSLAACLSAITTSGCDPIVTIAGATFPSWLLCIIMGAILAAFVRPLVVLSRLEPHLGPLTIFYPSLIATFAMIIWVIFFNRV